MEYDCPFIILLSGTPGTGKSTLAKQLCLENGWKIFALGEYIIENEYYISENKKLNTKTIDTDKAAYMGAREILDNYMDSSVVIIDSHYADIIMDGFIDLNQENYKKCVSEYLDEKLLTGIVLRCHPHRLQERLSHRNYSRNKIMENLQAEILSESTKNLLDVLSEHLVFEIDTSEKSLSEISTAIYEWYCQTGTNKISRDSILQKVGEIDWVRELNKAGTLDDYFKDDLGEKTPIDLEELGDYDK